MISNAALPAMIVPGRVPIVPLGVSGYGHACSANATLVGGVIASKPSRSIFFAPPAPSSAGWNTNRIVPGGSARSSRILASARAAPRSIAMWPSCPHACITPGVWLRSASGMSDCSCSGSASMSARRRTTGSDPSPTTPTTPGGETSTCAMPIVVSSRLMIDDVARSFHIVSGARWSSRRTRTTYASSARDV